MSKRKYFFQKLILQYLKLKQRKLKGLNELKRLELYNLLNDLKVLNEIKEFTELTKLNEHQLLELIKGLSRLKSSGHDRLKEVEVLRNYIVHGFKTKSMESYLNNRGTLLGFMGKSIWRRYQFILIRSAKSLFINHSFPKSEGLVNHLTFWIPRKHRQDIRADLLDDCEDLRTFGSSEWRVRIHVLWQLIICVFTLVPSSILSKCVDTIVGKLKTPNADD